MGQGLPTLRHLVHLTRHTRRKHSGIDGVDEITPITHGMSTMSISLLPAENTSQKVKERGVFMVGGRLVIKHDVSYEIVYGRHPRSVLITLSKHPYNSF